MICVARQSSTWRAAAEPGAATTRAVRLAFTLTELLVVLAIVAILGSLALSGMAVAQRRARIAKTESTIRKIHEVITPHYERFLTRKPPNLGVGGGSAYERNCLQLISTRRIQALELPDGWTDLLAVDLDDHTAISRKLRKAAVAAWTDNDPRNPNPVPPIGLGNSDAECLWLAVMRGGYADPGIVAHFREDELGDTNANGQREFLDGWNRPIRFLRWAPGFVSRYQPLPDMTGSDTRSHDAFDLAGVDPFALNTLMPLIFSGGPDGKPDIRHRSDDGQLPPIRYDPRFPLDAFVAPNVNVFSYTAVRYDPYFVARNGHMHRVSGQQFVPVKPYLDRLRSYEEPGTPPKWQPSPAAASVLDAYMTRVIPYGFGAVNPDKFIAASDPTNPTGRRILQVDDVTNHSMSR